MIASCKRFAARVLVTGCAAAMLATPVLAKVVWRIDPLTLPPPLRQQALTAPYNIYGPTGDPVPNGCHWSRMQVPTTQGLRWILEEECDGAGPWR
jgi:hypothetical protein